MMLIKIIQELKRALLVLILLSVITGVLYPALITGLAQILFHEQANGSLIKNRHQDIIGSRLIGQNFVTSNYFWGRLSATPGKPYNPMASAGANLASTSQSLIEEISKRLKVIALSNPVHQRAVPIDLITSSGSGLDPDITVAAALYQVPRVAQARHIRAKTLIELIQTHTEPRQFGLLGVARVNVLELNQALDQLTK